MALAQRMITGGVLLLAVVAFTVPGIVSECSAKEASTFSGEVTSVDLDKSVVTVKNAITVAFPVTADTVLSKGGFDIKLNDINVGNYVTAGYYDNDNDLSNGPSKVLSIMVDYDKK